MEVVWQGKKGALLVVYFRWGFIDKGLTQFERRFAQCLCPKGF